MKRYDPMRADARAIEDKALGLIMAMTDEEAHALHSMLSGMALRKSKRAEMFVGAVSAQEWGK